MTSISEMFDMEKLAKAEEELKKLEAAAIERARVYRVLNNKSVAGFMNDKGFSVQVNRYDLLNENAENVTFYDTDVQGRGSTNTSYVPRDFIFGEPSEKEIRWQEFQTLKQEFEKE